MPVRAVDGDEAMARLAEAVRRMSPPQVKAFAEKLTDPADVDLLERVMAQHANEGWRAHPAAMAEHLDATFRRHAYVELLSRKFRDAVEGRSKRQIWNLQARLGKSLLGSQWSPTWALDLKPDARFILVSYGKTLAVENAVGIRDRILQHQDSLRVRLEPGRRRMDRFTTTEGGGVLAAGIKGAVRGFGAGQGGGLIIDDAFKDWQEAHSENARNLVWNQYRGTFVDRLDDETAFVIVIGHRVHEDDLVGRLENDSEIGGTEWEKISLPALALPGDPLGREVGEPLVPERFSVAFIQEQMRAMGSYLASALMQQNPAPEEGNDLLRAWFVLEEQPPTKPDQAITSWDLKLKDKEAGDYVVGQAWWRTGADYWLMDQIRGQYDHATTANAIALLAVRRPECKTHVIEAAGSADDVIPQLRNARPDYVLGEEMSTRLGMNEAERVAVQRLRRRGMSGLVREKVSDGAKPVRARTFIAPSAESGNVHLLAYSPFVPHLLDEIAAFPNGTHDDQVDAMSQALKRLTKSPASVKSAKGKRRPEPRAGQRVQTVRTGTARVPTASVGRLPRRVLR